MLFLNRARLVILSQPKTGTTALENVLTPRSSISISKPPELKHMSYRGFMAYMAYVIIAIAAALYFYALRQKQAGVLR